MPLLPKNEQNDTTILPNPKENYSVSEAYSSVYQAVIEASTISTEEPQNTQKEIPFSYTIGYASSLVNFALSCIVDAEKILDELKEMQMEISSCNPDELQAKLFDFDIKRIKKINTLKEVTNKTCFDIKIFEKERQNFSLVLVGKITKKLSFSLPNAIAVIEQVLKLDSAQSLTTINFETIDREILNLKTALLEEHINIKQAREAINDEQIASTIANLDEAKEIIEKLKDTMINKPRLINLNQSNISKNTLINIRKL